MAYNYEEGSWHLCVDWLVRCQVVSYDQVNSTVHDVQAFAQMLRDGVVLCNLINKIRPGTIDNKSFSHKPQASMFLYLKNIRVFLQACKKGFGLKESDLFDPPDLVDGHDFSKVIYTLSVLSNSKEALKSGMEGFKAVRDEIYSINSIYDDDDENDRVYNNLDNSFDDDYEEVYGTLIEMPAMQSRRAGPVVSKRDLIIKELVDTEINYVEVLNLIVENFLNPLQDEIHKTELGVVFRYIKDLHRLHKQFLNDLQTATAPASQQQRLTLAECFTKRKTEFTIYGKYCVNFSDAQETLTRLMKESSSLKSRIEQLNSSASRANRQFGLADLLSVPFQRSLKYHLLLQELLKQTDKNHPDYPSLKDALDAMQDVALYNNELKRDSEILQVISEIENSISNLHRYLPPHVQLRQYGRRLHDGELKMKGPNDNTFVSRYLFLFDKILLCCKQRADKYSYQECVLVAHYNLVNDGLAGRDKAMSGFSLRERLPDNVDADEYKLRRYDFGSRSAEQCTRWQDAFKMALENVCPAGALTDAHQFVLTTFDESPTQSCNVCHKLLKGSIFQGYKCKRTSMIAHKECLIKAEETSKPVAKPDMRAKPPAEQPTRSVEPRPGAGQRAQVNGPGIKNRKSVIRPDSLHNFAWFAGRLSRTDAVSLLEDKEVGTYLVRTAVDEDSAEEKFAVSVICRPRHVKHIRIQKNGENHFCLVQFVSFPSVIKLVEYYQKNSLEENFPDVCTMLVTPYQQTVNRTDRPAVYGFCRALYDFSARNQHELSFCADDVIEIASKTSGMWWKGRLQGRVGRFPANYVEEIEG